MILTKKDKEVMLNALNKSIQHWRENVWSNLWVKYSGTDCACCMLSIWDKDACCAYCAIKIITRIGNCEGTTWITVTKAPTERTRKIRSNFLLSELYEIRRRFIALPIDTIV